MDPYIERLSEIEETAEAIVKNAELKKSALEKEMQEKRNNFDKELEASTEEKISMIRENLKNKMSQLLDSQADANQLHIQKLEKDYQENHSTYAQKIFEHIIEV